MDEGAPRCTACGPGPVATRRLLPMPEAAVPRQHHVPAQFVPTIEPDAWSTAPSQPQQYAGRPPPPYAPLPPPGYGAQPAGTIVPAWPTAPARRGGLVPKWWAGIAAGVVLLSVLLHSGVGATGHTFHGSQGVHDSSAESLADGSSCDAYGGYSDVGQGSAVYITDANGDQVGRGVIEGGTVSGAACVFHFTVTGIADSSEYGIRIGHRNAVTFTRSELETDGWSPVLTLGD